MIEGISIADYCRKYNQFMWAEKGLPALTPKWGRPKLLVQTKAKATPKPKVIPGPGDQQEGWNIPYPPNQPSQVA